MTNSQTIQLSGMTCPACEKLVSKRLEKIIGVENVAADHQTGRVLLTADRDIPVGEIKLALANTQYTLL